jgi:hypothetical protein
MTHSPTMTKVLARVADKLDPCSDGDRAARRYKTPESLIKGFAKRYPHWLDWWAYRILREDCPPKAEMYRDCDRALNEASGGWAFRLQPQHRLQIVRWWIEWVLST